MMRSVISASGQGESGMDRGDDVIEFGQQFVLEIERAVTENVALDAGKEPEVVEVLVELADHRDLGAQPGVIETARLDRTSAVIGDAEILQAELLRRRGHFFQRIAAVARGGMAMKRAAQIFRLDQSGQAFSRRPLRIRRSFRAARAECKSRSSAR